MESPIHKEISIEIIVNNDHIDITLIDNGIGFNNFDLLFVIIKKRVL